MLINHTANKDERISRTQLDTLAVVFFMVTIIVIYYGPLALLVLPLSLSVLCLALAIRKGYRESSI